MMRQVIRWVVTLILFMIPTVLVLVWALSASQRLASAAQAANAADSSTQVAVAAAADEAYCTPQLKQILRRVLQSCGLLGREGDRGCRPVEARNVATMSGTDFNALFIPMRERGGIVQFERGSDELDERGAGLVETIFADRRGASYFFVVSRASPDGPVERNRELSRGRAEAVLGHLQRTFHDPELESQVGLLWLGEEYAQLAETFCSWRRSGEGECRAVDINRSAFVAWIDCRL